MKDTRQRRDHWGQLDARGRRELNEERRPFEEQVALEQSRIKKLDAEIRALDSRLDNARFRERAPGPVVAETAQRREDAVAERAAVEARLAGFSAPPTVEARGGVYGVPEDAVRSSEWPLGGRSHRVSMDDLCPPPGRAGALGGRSQGVRMEDLFPAPQAYAGARNEVHLVSTKEGSAFASYDDEVKQFVDDVNKPAISVAPLRRERLTAALQQVARAASVQEVYECRSCGAHRSIGYRCCGMYIGTMGEAPVRRRNVHLHPEADEDEVVDFLRASLARKP